MELSVLNRFWSKVDKNGPVPNANPALGPCWLWTAGKTSDGYGAFWFHGKTISAPRFVLSRYGTLSLPEGIVPDHLCRTRACVREDHLRPLTNAQNVLAGESPTARNARKTRCHKGHELSGENLIVRLIRCRSGGRLRRICRMCRIERKRLWRSQHPGIYAEADRRRAVAYYWKNREAIKEKRRAEWRTSR